MTLKFLLFQGHFSDHLEDMGNLKWSSSHKKEKLWMDKSQCHFRVTDNERGCIEGFSLPFSSEESCRLVYILNASFTIQLGWMPLEANTVNSISRFIYKDAYQIIQVQFQELGSYGIIGRLGGIIIPSDH